MRQVLLEIDPQGAKQVKQQLPESVLVFVEAPTMNELRQRLNHRGSETDDQIEVRMHTAIREMELAGMYDFVITNDNVAQATDELVGIIDTCAETASDTDKD